MTAERIISSNAGGEEEAVERAIRPRRLAEYIGQAPVKTQLEIFISAAAQRGEALDHVLIFGPPGLGKTTLAHIIAAELGVNLRQTSGPVLERPGDLAALLTNLQPRDVLFVDEIHRLSAGGRGGAVPGDGGLPARHHDRRGPGGALDQARPAALHAGRRDHARRAADLAAARSLRHRAAARVLRGRGAGADRGALGGDPRRAASTPAARSASRSARAARRASPTGCCGGCATTPRCGSHGRIDAAGRGRGARPARGRRSGLRHPGPQAPARRSSSASTAARWASTAWRRRSARSAARSRT